MILSTAAGEIRRISLTGADFTGAMAVTHCLCERKSFGEVLEWARERGIDSQETVQLHLGCGRHCGLCKPFIEYMLATGVTDVPWPCPALPASTLAD